MIFSNNFQEIRKWLPGRPYMALLGAFRDSGGKWGWGLRWKIWIFFQKLFFTAKKKRPDALNATQNPQLLTKYGFQKNQEIPPKIIFFGSLGEKKKRKNLEVI